MTYPAPLLPDLLVGWQKVADRYKISIYVFQTGDTYLGNRRANRLDRGRIAGGPADHRPGGRGPDDN